MEKQILLSISILVSGREDTTKQCISSLDRLRRRVPCELILVDTGCPEKMRQWLEQQADKMIPFKWCNDFAAARNAGLQEASGKWFMFLDDDEWFESTGRLEQFFLSGEYKRYASACYVIRNYIDMEGRQWQDVPLPRMVRRERDTQFVYPVHEMLWPRYEPVRQLEDYVHHYGYASADPKVQKEKHQRNLGLLLSAIEDSPHCMHHYLQAVMEYIAMDDLEDALQTAEEGICHYDAAAKDNGSFLNGLYAAAVKLRVMKRQYRDACGRGMEILAYTGLSRLAKASIYGDLTIAWSARVGNTAEEGRDTGYAAKEGEKAGYAIEEGKGTGYIAKGEYKAGYKEAAEYLQKYLQEKKYFSAHSAELLTQQTLILDQCFEPYHYQMIMSWSFAGALFAGEVAAAEELLHRENAMWWMEAVQNWYTFTTEVFREKWKSDFQALAVKNKGQCHEMRRLYEALTAPPPTDRVQAQKQTIGKGAVQSHRMVQGISGQETNGTAKTENISQTKTSAQTETSAKSDTSTQTVTAEMEALAAQLKIQIRQLMELNQEAAALAAVRQLIVHFPSDGELKAMQKELEGRQKG